MSFSRSYLFVPGTNKTMIEKAITSDADSIIIDLEDAVALSEKQAARRSIESVSTTFNDKKPIYIRINDISTAYWEVDVECAVRNGACGIMIPKVESKEDVRLVCHRIRELIHQNKKCVDRFRVIPLIETAKGIQYIYDISGADPMIVRLAFGAIDFSLDIDCELTPHGLELLYARSQIVIASRIANLGSPIDTVYVDLHNNEGLMNEAIFARQIGFKSKLTIHPRQIQTVHQVFTLSAQELESAQKIVDAFEQAEKQGIASIMVDNRLVDYPVYKKSKEKLTGRHVDC